MQRMISLIAVLILFAFIGWAMSAQADEVKVKTTDYVWSEEKPTEPLVIEYHEKPTEEVQLPSVTDLTGVKRIEKKVWSDIQLTEEEQIALWDKCKELDINYWFMLALIESESNFKADAVGDHGNSVGYMQINKVNWKRMKEQYGYDVNVPLDNLMCGAVMFAELANKYDTIEEVVMGYKCGEGRAKELISQGFVLSCVEKITNRSIELQNLHMEVEE